jgi:hypothetical protein
MQVGNFPGLESPHRRIIRAPINPMDKATVVSILPKPILETKITIQPGVFEIKPGTFENPAVLVVGSSSWWREIDQDQPLLEIPVSSVQVADSIVADYCNGLLACDMADRMPGLFYVPGEYTVEKLKKDHTNMLIKAKAQQKAWYMELVRIADILWARTNGNPLAINDDARLACKELNIENKPWLGDLQTAALVRCVACGSLRNGQFPICQTCKAIADPALAKQLGITFAQ